MLRLYVKLRKFYIGQNNNKVDSIETGRIVFADLRSWSNLEKCMHTTLLINDDKSLSSLLDLQMEFYLFDLLNDV